MGLQYNDALFRATFPEFENTVTYPEPLLSMYWEIACDYISASDSPCAMLNGKSREYAINSMAAHLLVVAKKAARGKQGGFTTSSTIDKVSVQKLAPPVKDMYGWWLSQSPYGQGLMALLEAVSVGGISVGGMPERFSFRKVNGVFL